MPDACRARAREQADETRARQGAKTRLNTWRGLATPHGGKLGV
jgi:hypothetical protein